MSRQKKHLFSVFGLCSFLFFPLVIACSSSDPESTEVKTALSISNITDDGVTCNVNIVCDTSNIDITEKGICYGLSTDPTVESDVIVSMVTGTSFTSVIDDLEPATTYYIRAFVKANDEYSYSTTVSFTTAESISEYEPTNIVYEYDGYTMVWFDEFNLDGRPSDDWTYESGYVRNSEAQYYTDSEDNSAIEDGCLVITALRNTGGHSYTSSSLTTENSHAFMYGRFEIRAKIPVEGGSWPAIWTVGNQWNWPSGGEIDIMEYYQDYVLANACWGSSTAWVGIWDSAKKKITTFTSKDADWIDKFHVWRMDWDYDYIRLYLDGSLMNEIELSKTYNQGGYRNNKENPFRYYDAIFGQYIILNLALGGSNGGAIDDTAFPMEYMIDYVRVYQVNE